DPVYWNCGPGLYRIFRCRANPVQSFHPSRALPFDRHPLCGGIVRGGQEILMSQQVLRGVSCPACGGSLDVQEGTLIFSCKFCKAQLLVRGERGVPRYYVGLELKREEVIAKVAKWFQSYDKAPDLRTVARFADVFPVFVPFWNIRGQMRGWMLGDIKKTRDKETYWEPVEREIRENHELTAPACDIGEFGVKWVDLKGDNILPFDLESVQKQGMTFGVLSSKDEALQSAAEKFQDWSESAQRIDRVSFSRITWSIRIADWF